MSTLPALWMNVPELLIVPVPDMSVAIWFTAISKLPVLFITAELAKTKSLPLEPLQVIVPWLFQVTVSRVLFPELSMVPAVTPDVVVKVPEPEMVEATELQVKPLVTETAPLACKVPPLSVRLVMLMVLLKSAVPEETVTRSAVLVPTPVMVMVPPLKLTAPVPSVSESATKVMAPVSVVRPISISMPFSALTASVLNVEAAVSKVTTPPAAVALSVTVPVMLLLLAAVTLST